MAYVSKVQRQQLDNLTNQGSAVLTEGNPGAIGTGGTSNASAMTQAATGGRQFVNFQDLVDANRISTEEFAGQVGKQIGLQDATALVGTSQANADKQVQEGTVNYDQQLLDKVLANPNDSSLYDTQGFKNLSAILGGRGYGGPNDATPLYSDASRKVQDVSDKAANLTDPSGLKSLFINNPNVGTTPGGANLDVALINATPGSREQLEKVKADAGKLKTALDTAKTNTAGQIKTAIDSAAARKNEVVGKAGAARTALEQENQAQLDQLRADEQALVDKVKGDVAKGDLSSLKDLFPDFTDADTIKQLLTQWGFPVDLTPYSTIKAGEFTTGDAMSAEEQARYQGLTDKFGLDATNFLQAAGDKSRGAFAGDAAKTDIQRLIAERTAAAEALAREQAEAARLEAERLAREAEEAAARGAAEEAERLRREAEEAARLAEEERIRIEDEAYNAAVRNAQEEAEFMASRNAMISVVDNIIGAPVMRFAVMLIDSGIVPDAVEDVVKVTDEVTDWHTENVTSPVGHQIENDHQLLNDEVLEPITSTAVEPVLGATMDATYAISDQAVKPVEMVGSGIGKMFDLLGFGGDYVPWSPGPALTPPKDSAQLALYNDYMNKTNAAINAARAAASQQASLAGGTSYADKANAEAAKAGVASQMEAAQDLYDITKGIAEGKTPRQAEEAVVKNHLTKAQQQLATAQAASQSSSNLPAYQQQQVSADKAAAVTAAQKNLFKRQAALQAFNGDVTGLQAQLDAAQKQLNSFNSYSAPSTFSYGAQQQAQDRAKVGAELNEKVEVLKDAVAKAKTYQASITAPANVPNNVVKNPPAPAPEPVKTIPTPAAPVNTMKAPAPAPVPTPAPAPKTTLPVTGGRRALALADGGEVVGPGSGTSDSVPANLSNGEFVIPEDVVRILGTKFFDDLIAQYHKGE